MASFRSHSPVAIVARQERGPTDQPGLPDLNLASRETEPSLSLCHSRG